MMMMKSNNRVNTMQFMMTHQLKKKGKTQMKKKNKKQAKIKMNMLMIWKVSIMMKMLKCKKFLNKASCKISLSVHTSIKK